MSTVKFIEHNGKRVLVEDQRVTTEVRCDLCGEFIDRDDAQRIQVVRFQRDVVLGRPLEADAHPSCADKALDHFFLTGPVT